MNKTTDIATNQLFDDIKKLHDISINLETRYHNVSSTTNSNYWKLKSAKFSQLYNHYLHVMYCNMVAYDKDITTFQVTTSKIMASIISNVEYLSYENTMNIENIQKCFNILQNKYVYNALDDKSIIDLYIENLFYAKWDRTDFREWDKKFKIDLVDNGIFDFDEDYCYDRSEYDKNLEMFLTLNNKKIVLVIELLKQ